ncbi:MAG: PspA-associated protein PspAA [Actinomycetes bacterium]
MIVRILGEGQFRLDDAELDMLAALDDDVEAAAKAGDAEWLNRALLRLIEEIRTQGTPLDPDLLIDSDLIIPDAEVTVEQVREWMGNDDSFSGLLP